MLTGATRHPAERGFMFENRYTTLTYHNVEGGTDHLNEGSEKITKK